MFLNMLDLQFNMFVGNLPHLQDRMRRRPDEQMYGASGGRGSDTLLLPKPALVLIPVLGAG